MVDEVNIRLDPLVPFISESVIQTMCVFGIGLTQFQFQNAVRLKLVFSHFFNQACPKANRIRSCSSWFGLILIRF